MDRVVSVVFSNSYGSNTEPCWSVCFLHYLFRFHQFAACLCNWVAILVYPFAISHCDMMCDPVNQNITHIIMSLIIFGPRCEYEPPYYIHPDHWSGNNFWFLVICWYGNQGLGMEVGWVGCSPPSNLSTRVGVGGRAPKYLAYLFPHFLCSLCSCTYKLMGRWGNTFFAPLLIKPFFIWGTLGQYYLLPSSIRISLCPHQDGRLTTQW